MDGSFKSQVYKKNEMFYLMNVNLHEPELMICTSDEPTRYGAELIGTFQSYEEAAPYFAKGSS